METILALSLAAVLMGAIYFAIDQSWKMSSSGREEMARAQLARALIHRMEVDIRAITFVPPPPTEDTDTTSTSSSSSSASSGSSNSAASSSGSGGGTGSGGTKGTGSGKGGSGGTGGSGSGGTGSGSGTSNSSTSAASTDTETTVPNSKSIGIRGTSQKMEMSIARPRRDLLPASAAGNVLSKTSDLRAVTYAFLAPGSGATSGLVRTEGDRMAVEVLEASGNSANQISNVQMLAPEVATLQIRYFDGRVWSAFWDSETSGRIPRAVEVSISFLTSRRKPPLFNVAYSRSMNSFRSVIVIPVSDPYPKEFLP